VIGAKALLLPLVVFTGRFQPFHRDHLEMVHHALGLSEKVLIGVTNPDAAQYVEHAASAHRHLAAANPYSYQQRQQLIDAALQADGIAAIRYDIVPFPLDTPALWSSFVAPGTPQLVRVFSDWELEKVRRFAAAGYPPLVVEGDPVNRVTATEVRRALAAGEAVPGSVPVGARELLQSWLGTATEVAHAG
jgi:cytidyltransferase-like protein